MRDYVILNGINSNTITGLLIQKLPPITKPKIRTNIEEIDGRDGDIVTKLGYSAYDKQISIGLYGKYDIDEVISFFSSDGIIVFSNEEDKYYKYQIIEQIDYEKLLRFKKATIKFHVQPFKYSIYDNKKIFNITSNLLNIKEFTQIKNGITLTVENNSVKVEGLGSEDTEFYIPISTLNLNKNSYKLSVNAKGTNIGNCFFKLINTSPDNTNSFGGNGIEIKNSGEVYIKETFIEEKKYNYIWICITAGTVLNFTFDAKVSAIDITNISIRNVGNIYSKPIITLYGSDTVEISLNNKPKFTIDFGEFDYITIDVANMEAYSDNKLANRNIIGDYDNLFFDVGNNIITWTGDIKKIEINDYSRWI